MELDHIAAGILYLLWKRRRSNDGSLVPANTLHMELLEGRAKTPFDSRYLKLPAVKKSLRRLKKEGMVEYGESKKSSPIPGPAPNGYRLSADAPIITWRATAAIVMFLHNHSEHRLRREVIIKEAVKLGLTHHDQDQPLSPQEISDLIDWCIRKGYIKEEQITIDEPLSPKVEKRLITTSMVDQCGLFLVKIAEEVKRQAPSGQPSSGYDKGGLQRRG